jgi:hypothetical protein
METLGVGGHRRADGAGRVVVLGVSAAVALCAAFAPGCTREEQTAADAFCVDMRRLDDTVRSLDSTRDREGDLQLVRHRLAQLPDDDFRRSAGTVVQRYIDGQAGVARNDLSNAERADLRAALISVSEACTSMGHDLDLMRPYGIA